MNMDLKSKNNLHFINGALPIPQGEDRDSIAWDSCNTIIISSLNNFVDSEISQSILWMETASSIWKELKDRFYHDNIFRTSDIQEEIFTLKQGDSCISSYYTKLKMLWQELDNLRPIPACECDISYIEIDKVLSYKDFGQVI